MNSKRGDKNRNSEACGSLSPLQKKKERKSGRRRRRRNGAISSGHQKEKEKKKGCGGNCLLFLYGPFPGRSVGPPPRRELFLPLTSAGLLPKKEPSLVCGEHTCFVYSCDFFFSLFPLGWLNGGPQLGVKAGLGDMGDQDQRESPPPVASPH